MKAVNISNGLFKKMDKHENTELHGSVTRSLYIQYRLLVMYLCVSCSIMFIATLSFSCVQHVDEKITN